MIERELSGLNHQDAVGECHRRLGHGVGATMVMTAGLTQRAQSAAASSSGHCIQCAERPVKGKKPWMTDKRTCESHTPFPSSGRCSRPSPAPFLKTTSPSVHRLLAEVGARTKSVRAAGEGCFLYPDEFA
jgi:hypothetical protein